MPLVFHSSNRLETLAAAYADIYAGRNGSPFAAEIIVVQTMGMGRYLSLRLADRCGISANLEFLFPNAVIDRLFGLILPELDNNAPPSRSSTTWRIMELLPELCRAPESADVFSPVSKYLNDDQNGLKLYQLAGKIADVFDQYQVYRPEMVLAWDKNNDWFKRHPLYAHEHAWQLVLWQRFHDDQTVVHRAAAGHDFLARLVKLTPLEATRLPSRITIFGVSVIPRFHLDIFQAAARYSAIDFFLLSPCREYWGYIKNSKEIKWAERQSGKNADELLLEEINPILASQGILGRDFLNMILELDNYELKENFIETLPVTCLQTIQDDLLNLVNPLEAQKKPAANPADGSIRFHSCHGPLREVEVLYDQLLAIMADDESLSPADILVMTPDLATYAPLIRAVFANPYDERTRIPFSIADTGSRREQTIMEGFDNLLQTLRSRFRAPEILALLDNPIIAARFSFTGQDIAVIRDWLQGAGIRWGIDREMMAEQGLPPLEEISWKAGRQRLLLGYAMAPEPMTAVDGIYPFGDFNEDDSLLLGHFLDFFAMLTGFRREIKQPRSLSGWQKILCRIQEFFFSAEPPFSDAFAALERLIADLGGEEEKNSKIELSLENIRACLRDGYSGKLHSQGFMGSGLTFCAMLPMRSIPFKVIAMIGMNDTTFPRQKKNLEFDLTMVEPRPGDRNPRENDKYLFLETFISARKIFYLSFCGQSLQDNNQAPPSVLVSELLDYLARRYNLGTKEQDDLIIKHRIQPFNEKYFLPGYRLSSFSVENCRAAAARIREQQEPGLFFARPLARPLEKTAAISLENLISFFKQPVKFLYNRVLGIYLNKEDKIISGAEIFVPDALQSYQLKEKLMAHPEEGPGALPAKTAMAAACGRIPLANPGAFYLEELEEEIIAWQNWLGPIASPLPPIDVDISLASGININGILTEFYQQFQLLLLPAKLGAKQGRNGLKITRKKELIRGWILHLAANCLPGGPKVTVVAGIDQTAVRFPPLDKAKQLLTHLVDIYLEGQERVIPFFPKFSLAMAEGKAAEKLAEDWGRDKYDGAADIYNSHCFGETIPLDHEFERLALEISTPLYQQVTLCREIE